MAKREFLMLSETFDEAKYPLAGWYCSEKMDGQRVFWDGGISRGIPVNKVPYANVAKDYRYVSEYDATGLWSRNGKVIRAPKFWLDKLPSTPLDGEIWAGHGKWELTASIIKDIRPDESAWKNVQYWIFESPPLGVVFGPGMVGSSNDLFYKNFDGCLEWALDRANDLNLVRCPNFDFEGVYNWLKKQPCFQNQDADNPLRLLPQTRLPFSTPDALKLVENLLLVVTTAGGEGLMIRNPSSAWTPVRSKHLLKIKRWYDDEGTVLYYTWGKQTNRGSKRLGMMGNIGILWKDKIVEVCGFSYQESKICYLKDNGEVGNDAGDIGKLNSGKKVQAGLGNPMFPIGSKITFRYRELTAAGIPKNANYWRKPLDY